jgi:2-amino-4-hydroxy-6-hydroxymethyldihydropteridine diphosphokinase
MIGRYLVSLGSNIDPYGNVERMLLALLDLSPRLDVSRIIETEPVGLVEGGQFLNLSVCLYSILEPAALKRQFDEIETRLGRDRRDALSKIKSRPADLDILFGLPSDRTFVRRDKLPEESYVRPALIELLHYLGLDCGETVPQLPDGVLVPVGPVQTGLRPATLYRPAKDRPIKLVSPGQPIPS